MKESQEHLQVGRHTQKEEKEGHTATATNSKMRHHRCSECQGHTVAKFKFNLVLPAPSPNCQKCGCWHP